MKPNDDQIKTLRVLAKENAAEILLSIVQRSARSPSQLAVELGLQPTQVYRVLDELSEAELVAKSTEAATPLKSWVFYRPTAKGKEAANLVARK